MPVKELISNTGELSPLGTKDNPVRVAAVQPRESAPQPNTPAPFLGTEGAGVYRVSLRENKADVSADNRSHAFALFCDGLKAWPSPKIAGLKIEFLGPSPA